MRKNVVIVILFLIIASFSACKSNMHIVANSNKELTKNDVASDIQSTMTTIKNTQINNESENSNFNNSTKTPNNEKKLVDVYVDINGVRSSVNDFKKIDKQIELINKGSIKTDTKMTSKIGTIYKVYSDKSEEAIIEVFVGSDNCYYMKTITQTDKEFYKIEPSKDNSVLDILN